MFSTLSSAPDENAKIAAAVRGYLSQPENYLKKFTQYLLPHSSTIAIDEKALNSHFSQENSFFLFNNRQERFKIIAHTAFSLICSPNIISVPKGCERSHFKEDAKKFFFCCFVHLSTQFLNFFFMPERREGERARQDKSFS